MEKENNEKYESNEDKPTELIEADNQEGVQNNTPSSSDNGSMGFIIGAIGGSFGLFMAFKAWRAKKALKKEREKNKAYMEEIKKHQAEIAAIKGRKQREEYKSMLWEELMSKKEE